MWALLLQKSLKIDHGYAIEMDLKKVMIEIKQLLIFFVTYMEIAVAKPSTDRIFCN